MEKTLELGIRNVLPEDLRYLLRKHPREGWRNQPGLAGTGGEPSGPVSADEPPQFLLRQTEIPDLPDLPDVAPTVTGFARSRCGDPRSTAQVA